MPTVTIENVPESLYKKIWKKTDFSKISGVYFDGMDWCQYDEVIVNEDDISSLEDIEKNISNKDWKEFLSNLIK